MMDGYKDWKSNTATGSWYILKAKKNLEFFQRIFSIYKNSEFVLSYFENGSKIKGKNSGALEWALCMTEGETAM